MTISRGSGRCIVFGEEFSLTSDDVNEIPDYRRRLGADGEGGCWRSRARVDSAGACRAFWHDRESGVDCPHPRRPRRSTRTSGNPRSRPSVGANATSLFTPEDLTFGTLDAATALIEKIEGLRKHFENDKPMAEHLRQSRCSRSRTSSMYWPPAKRRQTRTSGPGSRPVAHDLAANPADFRRNGSPCGGNTPEFRVRFLTGLQD